MNDEPITEWTTEGDEDDAPWTPEELQELDPKLYAFLYHAIDDENAATELAAIAQPALLHTLIMEARRRAAVISELITRTPWSGPARMTPHAAGLRSVAADVATGRLP